MTADSSPACRPIGSPLCPIASFADVWRRISRAFRADNGVVGYDIMNEPVDMQPADGLAPARVWDRASQSAVDSIRSTGDRKLILVEGNQWSGVQQWTRWNPRPWIHDPFHNIRYEAHHYWDPDNSGTYAAPYAADVAAARARGF